MTTQDTAIQGIALAVVARVIRTATSVGDIADLWAEYPDIGENDWIRIGDAVEHVADRLDPPISEFKIAYHTLASRAEGATT